MFLQELLARFQARTATAVVVAFGSEKLKNCQGLRGREKKAEKGICPHSCLTYFLVQTWRLDRTVYFVNIHPQLPVSVVSSVFLLCLC